MLFADLLSLHLVTFLMFFFIIVIIVHLGHRAMNLFVFLLAAIVRVLALTLIGSAALGKGL